jgi:hypothetical protein
MLKINRQAALKQFRTQSAKGLKLEPGTEISVMEVRENNNEDGSVTHSLICSTDKSLVINISLSDYFKMGVVNNGSHYTSEEGDEDIEIFQSFTIETAEDRKDRNGDLVYPLYAYEGWDEMRDEIRAGNAKFDWNALIESGLKEGITDRISPLQDYTIKIG